MRPLHGPSSDMLPALPAPLCNQLNRSQRGTRDKRAAGAPLESHSNSDSEPAAAKPVVV